jgi:hypothetical protein
MAQVRSRVGHGIPWSVPRGVATNPMAKAGNGIPEGTRCLLVGNPVLHRSEGNQVPWGTACPPLKNRVPWVGNPVPPNRHRNRHITASEPSLSGDAGTQPAPREPRGAGGAIPIPRDWRPSERVFDWAATQAMTRPWVEAQVDEFLVYWSDTGECRKSWDATFINRLRSVQAQQPAGISDAPRQRLSAKDYRQGATPLAAIPWLRRSADG